MRTNSVDVMKSCRYPLTKSSNCNEAHLKHMCINLIALNKRNTENRSQIDAREKSSIRKIENLFKHHFSLHFKAILEKITSHTYSVSCSLYYFSVNKITSFNLTSPWREKVRTDHKTAHQYHANILDCKNWSAILEERDDGGYKKTPNCKTIQILLIVNIYNKI